MFPDALHRKPHLHDRHEWQDDVDKRILWGIEEVCFHQDWIVNHIEKAKNMGLLMSGDVVIAVFGSEGNIISVFLIMKIVLGGSGHTNTLRVIEAWCFQVIIHNKSRSPNQKKQKTRKYRLKSIHWKYNSKMLTTSIIPSDEQHRNHKQQLRKQMEMDMKRHMEEQAKRNPRLRRIYKKMEEPVTSITHFDESRGKYWANESYNKHWI